MKIFISTLLCCLLSSCLNSIEKTSSTKTFGAMAVMQGATSDKEALFVVSVRRQDDVQVQLLSHETKKVILTSSVKSIIYDHSAWKLIQFKFSGLRPGTSYGLRLTGDFGSWSDTREFSTFQTGRAPKRIALLSCMNDEYDKTGEIWKVVKSETPQALFMIGDNAYADTKIKGLVFGLTANSLWDRHMETRNALQVFRWKKLVPVFATWDDHDFGSSDGGENFPIKRESAKVFSSFFPMNLKSETHFKGPGVAHSFLIGEHNFLFLDNRSFRGGGNKMGNHFGSEQRQWIYGQIKKKKLNWLISGDQFFGGYHSFESFQGLHTTIFKKFITKLKSFKSPLLLVSGDRHMSEVMKIPSKEKSQPSLYEITSSPVHSKVYPGAAARDKNPYRLKAIDGKWNFIMVDLINKKKGYQLKLEAIGHNHKRFFTQTISI